MSRRSVGVGARRDLWASAGFLCTCILSWWLCLSGVRYDVVIEICRLELQAIVIMGYYMLATGSIDS